jgi:hypothetical protein
MIEKTTNQMAIYQPVILNNQSNGNISTCDIKQPIKWQYINL